MKKLFFALFIFFSSQLVVEADMLEFELETESSQQLNGVINHHIEYFEASSYQKFDSLHLNVDVKHSGSNIDIQSNLTVLLNNQPIKTFLIPNDVLSLNLDLELPVEYILEGTNELVIRTYHRISDDYCEDELNPGNWVMPHHPQINR